MGNALMELKQYDKAVEAYKNALRNNPSDEKTRYNYALAKEMLKNNPPPPRLRKMIIKTTRIKIKR
jgi:tetratricopeptide (TPR) repeat protein